MKMRTATLSDLPALKTLWQRCFGDEQSYIDFYFTNGFDPFRTLVLQQEEQVVAMLTLLPVVLEQTTDRLPGSYVYAVATHPDCQGRGYMRSLMAYAEQTARAWGDLFLCLVPATPSLFEMYSKLGYQTVTALRQLSLVPQTAATATVTALTKQRYFAARKTWLSGFSDCVRFVDEAYLMREMDCTGTETLLVKTPTQSGILAGYREEDCLVVRETSLDELALQAASGTLCALFEASAIRAKLPQGETSYAMAKPLSDRLLPSSCYMNLMLD